MHAALEKFFAKRKWNKEIVRTRGLLALALSIFIVVGIFWWLKLTGVTLAGDAFCGIPEHIHTEECTENTLTCTQDHPHTDGCYTVTYPCGLEEHTHTALCYSDSSADVERPEDWEKPLAELPHTTALGDRLIAVAKTQLGYTESIRNYKMENGLRRGYSRYGEWYGNPYGEWGTMFLDFCLYYSDVPAEDLVYASGPEALRVAWNQLNILKPISQRTPVKGDILFLDTDADGRADRVGLISEETGDRYKVIFGDYEDKVAEATLQKNDATLLCATEETALLTAIATPEELETVEKVAEDIAALPTLEQIGQRLNQLEEAGDIDAYAEYFLQTGVETRNLYARWQDTDILQPLIENGEDLQYYRSLWPMTLAILQDAPVNNINKYDTPNILVYGSGSIQSVMGTDMSYKFWTAFTVSFNATGDYYYISAIDNSANSKLPITLPSNGFVYLLWRDPGNTWDVKVGDRIEVPFSYKKGSVSSTAGYGNLSKVANKNNLTPIQSADTLDLIEVNLFNYGDSINSKYNSNKNYPGFQQEYGTPEIKTTSALTQYLLNFGNNITADMNAGINGVTNEGGSINTTANNANTPIQGTMNYNLSANGYPQLAYTASGFNSELSWLFSENAATSTTQMNSSNINGLFLQDPETGKYYFDSRLHHAQYNEEKNVFELYEQTLTPNYIMYPFGNFLPFNDINTQSTKVTSINRSYFSSLANSASVKHSNGFSSTRGEYNTLSTVLKNFVTRMNTEVSNTNWDYKAPIQKYFALAPPPDIEGDRVPEMELKVENMYNLDYDEATDMYFGMSMHMEFMMPKDGTTGPKGDQPMMFDFNGDDDVWVYVDGKLFLDLSGIHRHIGGRIDFQNGRVEYYQFNPESGQADISVDTGLIDPATGQTYRYTKTLENGTQKTIYYVPFSVLMAQTVAANPDILNEKGTFQNYSTHTIDFFYMERGSGSSVCNIEFNFPLIQKNSISVTKEMTATGDVSVLGDPDFKFQILKPDGVTPLIGAGITYEIYEAENQIKIGEGVTEHNGVFTLKAGQTAVFPGIDENAGQYFVRELLDTSVFEQYGTVTVDGKSTTKDHYKPNLTVGSGTFMGVDSDIKDISDGSTAFSFKNHVDIYKFGALKLFKTYRDYQSGTPPRVVTFHVEMGGKPLPVGSTYKVIDGTVITDKTVTAEGTVVFESDQTLWMPKILAGTVVKITEDAASADGYSITYSAVGMEITNTPDGNITYGTGTIPAGTTAAVTVVNDREGTKLEIPLKKTLLFPDGAPHTYTFRLTQITSLTDLTPTGLYIERPVEITQGTVETLFTLNYPPGTADGDYFYLIREPDATDTNGMDRGGYLVKVTVTTADGTAQAQITGRYRTDGTLLEEGTEMTFTNRLVTQLTVRKTVLQIQTEEVFSFTLTATVDGQPLEGIFHIQTVDGIQEVELIHGRMTFGLRHGQALTVLDLPYNTQWTVTETSAGGYFTRHSTDGNTFTEGTQAAGILTEAVLVSYENVGGYELPSTGTAARMMYLIGGWAILLLSLTIGFFLRRRNERRLR